MIATTRLLAVSTLLALVFGLLLVHQAGAEGRFRPRGYSEEARQILKESCKERGGSSFQTDYHYSYGSDVPTSVSTTCHYPDGTSGPTCEVGAIRVTCGKQILPADEGGPFGGPSGDTMIDEFDTNSSSETVDPGDGVLATPETDPAPRAAIVGADRSTVVEVDDDEQP